MGACRKGYRLYTRLGRRHFSEDFGFYRLRNWSWLRLVFEDTFMPLVCKFIGHAPYIPDRNDPSESACRRCHSWLNKD